MDKITPMSVLNIASPERRNITLAGSEGWHEKNSRLFTIVNSLLLIFSFANFRIIPGEVIPFFAAQRRYNAFGLVLTAFVAVLVISKLLYLANYAVYFDYRFIVNGLEILLIFMILSAERLSIKQEHDVIKIISITYFAFFVIVTLVPQLEYIKFFLMDRDVYFAELQDYGRGFAFLSPEPSYAGVFLVGLLMLGWQTSLDVKWLGLLSLEILLTGSIWAVAIAFVFVVFQARANIIGLLAAIISLAFVLFPRAFVPVFSLFSSRLAEFVLAFSDNGFFSLLDIEKAQGSSRVAPTLDRFVQFSEFTDYMYVETYSLFAQFVSVLGTYTGFAASVAFFVLGFRNLGTGVWRYAWIPFVMGPVALPTNYLILRRLRKDELSPRIHGSS